MQDSFNSAPTPPNLPVPGQAPPAGAAPNAPPIYQPGQPGQPAQTGHTLPYLGPVDMDPPTVAMPPQGMASPYSPTVQQLPAYPPPMAPPAAPLRPPRVPSRGRQRALPPPPSAPYAPYAPYAQPRASHPRAALAPARSGHWSAWIPLPHALLAIGVALLFVAMRLPWAVDSSGALVTLQSVSVSAPTSQDGGATMTALQVATNLAGAMGVLSAGVLVFNLFLRGVSRLLGGGCLAGCALVPLYPILLALVALLLVAQALAVGFGGLGGLAQLPVVQSYGMGSVGVAHYEPGYYLWYTGIMLNVAGMLGELAVGRR